MKPEDRTLKVLKGLDDNLGKFNAKEQTNKVLDNVTGTLRWVTEHLNVDEICDFIDKNQHEFERPDVIKHLLNEPFFNARKAH